MPWLDTKLRIPPGGPYTLTMNRTNWKKKSVRSGHIVCRSPSCSGLWKSDRLRILFSKYSKGLNYRKIGETALLFLIFVPNRRFIIKNLTFCDKNIKFTQF